MSFCLRRGRAHEGGENGKRKNRRFLGLNFRKNKVSPERRRFGKEATQNIREFLGRRGKFGWGKKKSGEKKLNK